MITSLLSQRKWKQAEFSTLPFKEMPVIGTVLLLSRKCLPQKCFTSTEQSCLCGFHICKMPRTIHVTTCSWYQHTQELLHRDCHRGSVFKQSHWKVMWPLMALRSRYIRSLDQTLDVWVWANEWLYAPEKRNKYVTINSLCWCFRRPRPNQKGTIPADKLFGTNIPTSSH